MKESTVKNWHKHCLLPDGTELQEHSIKTDRNIVVGEFCQIDYGLRGTDVYVGESSKIREYVWANGDTRIGNWSEIGGDVILLHDGGHRAMGADRSQTVIATENLILRYKDQGYKFVTVEALRSKS